MLNEARDPVTQWKAQNDHVFFFFFFLNHGYHSNGFPIAIKLTKLTKPKSDFYPTNYVPIVLVNLKLNYNISLCQESNITENPLINVIICSSN
jgi:hypothetical protein